MLAYDYGTEMRSWECVREIRRLLFNRMLLEYPDFMFVYAQKIEDEVNEKYVDIDIPESSQEELDAGWEDLCRRIREKYGEDTI